MAFTNNPFIRARMIKSSLALPLVVIAVSVTCSNGRDESSSRDRSAPPRLRLVEDLRLDAEAEDFSMVTRVYVGPRRREIVVPLPQDMHLRIYDSTGARVATVGRLGSGPGEFQHLAAIGWVADTLFVSDSRQRRVTYVGPDGKVLRTGALPAGLALKRLSNTGADTSFWSFETSAAYPDGSLLGRAVLSAEPPAGIFPASDGVVFVRISQAGTARLVARLPPNKDPRWTMSVGGFQKPVPFAFRPQSAVAADGSLLAHITADQSSTENGTYTVSLFGANGDTIFVRAYAYRGTAIPGSVRDSAIAAITASEGPPAGPFQALARQWLPPVYAPVERMTLGLDSTVWVDLRPDTEGPVTLILDQRGDAIGTVLVPAHSRIQRASRSHVWTTEIDEYGLASVVRYRVIGWPTRSF